MARAVYTRQELGKEFEAPSGYYQPLKEEVLEYKGRQVLYVLGTVAVETSCCGVGSWDYARVQGYAAEEEGVGGGRRSGQLQIDTIEDERDRSEIARLILDRHPGVRIEFR